MHLTPGSRVGSYELVAPLGAGGMGEVYLARDARLQRDVAIKVICESRLTDATARARFDREMAIVTGLTHPRICALLDAGWEGDRAYLVMELLRGETLATRLDRGKGAGLPVDEAVEIAIGLCEALAYAHRRGVVHRDVKPDNVMLTPHGVKLLDFGVARFRDPATPVDAAAGTATLSIVGTPAYMAPEQIDGQCDPRVDLFSLGAVLYEMLAGRRAFPGETSSDILGAVVRCAPQPLAEARPDVPPSLARLVNRCLQKDVETRWQSAADLAEALQWTSTPSLLPADAGAGTSAAGRHEPGDRRGLFALATGAAAVSALVGVLAFASGSPQAPQTFYVDDIPLPDETVWVPGQMAVSRDGRHVAVVTQRMVRDTTDFRLWTLEIGSGRGWQLVDGSGPEHVTYPSWSPDGTSLTYFRDHRLVRIALASKVPVALADAPDGRGAAWLDDDTIVFAPEPQGDIWQIPANGGSPAVVIRRQPGDLGVKYPSALPDGHVLFWAQRSTPDAGEVRVTSAAGFDSQHLVTQSASAGRVVDGTLFFVNSNQVVAQRLDAKTWRLEGRAEQVPADTWMGGNLGSPHFGTGGDLIGVQSVRREATALTWVDRTGAALDTMGPVAPYRTMALSPDGRLLIAETAAPGVDLAQLWLMDLASAAPRHLTTDVGAMLPVWHPAQDRVAFRASRGPGGSGAVYEYSLNGRAVRTMVETQTLAAARPAAWVDADRLLWWAADPTGRFNGIFVADAERFDHAYRTLRIGADIRGVALRPGGRGLAYWSNESGTFEVYVDTFPAPRSSPWKLSTGGGRLPRWSRDGRELFFVADGALQVVAMTGPDGGPAGRPRRLFAFEGSDYDVHPDGRLLVQRRRVAESHYLRVFRHWPARPANVPAGN